MQTRRTAMSKALLPLCSLFSMAPMLHGDLLPALGHQETVINGNASDADGILLDLNRPTCGYDPANRNCTNVQAAGILNFASPAFTGGSVNGANQAAFVNPLGSSTPYIFGGSPGTVKKNGGSTTVAWFSAFADATVLAASYWTNPAGPPGTNIGAVTLLNPLGFNLQQNTDGTISVFADNPGSAVAYSGLSIENGAPIGDYDAADFVSDMGLGSTVSTLIPSSGTLPSGTTLLATFTPSTTGYEAESITVSGAVVALGELEASAVPEPSSLVLALSGFSMTVWLYRRRQRANRVEPAEPGH